MQSSSVSHLGICELYAVFQVLKVGTWGFVMQSSSVNQLGICE